MRKYDLEVYGIISKSKWIGIVHYIFNTALLMFQVPMSMDKSSSGYFLRSSEDESYFPGRAAEIVAYGQVDYPFLFFS